jgi:small subunit ribosomal protein S16
VRLFAERINHWKSVGALPTDRVAKFLGHAGLAPMPVFPEQPIKGAPKKKAQERAAASAAAAG